MSRSDAGAPGRPDEGQDADPADEKWPVGFILTIVAVSLYLGWRLVQGIILLFEWLF